MSKLRDKGGSDMQIIVNAFEEEERELASTLLVEVIRHLANDYENNLNLAKLEYVRVSLDYGTELVQFQRERGLREGYTNDELGRRGFAQTLDYQVEGELRVAIFIDPAIIYLLGSDGQQRALHMIHHELCHAHDATVKDEMFG